MSFHRDDCPEVRKGEADACTLATLGVCVCVRYSTCGMIDHMPSLDLLLCAMTIARGKPDT